MYSYARQLYDYDRTRRRVAHASDQLPALHQMLEKTRQRIEEILASQEGPVSEYVPHRIAAVLKTCFEMMKRVDAKGAFLEVLRNYEMPVDERKVIERASKEFGKSRIVIKPERALATYETVLYEYQTAIDTAFGVMRRNERHSDEGSNTTLRVGSFQLINTGGFSDAIMAECAKVVARSEKLLREKGLARVCYGDVYVTNTVHRSTRVLAFYRPSDDTVYIRSNLKGKAGPAVTSVTHELGHRLQFKFLAGKTREIDDLYRALMRKKSEAHHDIVMDRTLWPQKGDTFSYKGESFVFDKIDVSRSNLVAIFGMPESLVRIRVPLAEYVQQKHPHLQAEVTTFVTRYAEKTPEENFAEMIAFYCEGNLPADQEPMLKAIIH